MRRERSCRISLCTALAVAAASCGQGSESALAASNEAASAPPYDDLLATFGEVTDQVLTNRASVADLVRLAEPLLVAERGEPALHERRSGWVVQELALDYTNLEGRLMVLPLTSNGTREFQIEVRGPSTSGAFQQFAEHRDLTLSFAFDAVGEPLFLLAMLQDRVPRSSIMSYQGKGPAQSGAVYTVGRTPEDSYWQPMLLEALIQGPQDVDPDVAETAEHQPGLIFTWQSTNGPKEASFGRLSDMAHVCELLM